MERAARFARDKHGLAREVGRDRANCQRPGRNKAAPYQIRSYREREQYDDERNSDDANGSHYFLGRH